MKKVRNVLFACMLLSGALFIYSACNNGGGPEPCCGNAKDANNDCTCDVCGETWDTALVGCGDQDPPESKTK